MASKTRAWTFGKHMDLNFDRHSNSKFRTTSTNTVDQRFSNWVSQTLGFLKRSAWIRSHTAFTLSLAQFTNIKKKNFALHFAFNEAIARLIHTSVVYKSELPTRQQITRLIMRDFRVHSVMLSAFNIHSQVQFTTCERNELGKFCKLRDICLPGWLF